MNKAMKLALKELPKIGCAVKWERPHEVAFAAANGRTVIINSRDSPKHVRNVIAREMDISHSLTGDRMSEFPVIKDYPNLRGIRLHYTDHFLERVKQMGEHGLDPHDIKHAVHDPSSVRADGDALFYCRGDIAVLVAREPRGDGSHAAVTLYWTSDQLWRERPRDEAT